MIDSRTKKFWQKWYKLDDLDRVKYIKFIAQNLDDYKVIKEKDQRIHAMATVINSYLEDVYLSGKR